MLSVVLLFGGSALHAHAYATEVPEGFERHNFPREISDKQFIFEDGQRKIHPEVEPLLNKPIFIKGWMYQQLKTSDITEFVLLKDSGECCFGGNPKPYDMIQVNMAEGVTADGYTSMIYVAGTLTADPSVDEGQAVYTMEVTHCGLAKTSF